jgi:hypothetical protein
MIDDLESNMQPDNMQSSSDKFPITQCQVPGSQSDINILYMTSSKKYLYLLTENGEILCIESKTLNPIQQSFSLSSSSSSGSNSFKENLTKIWTDRVGNHNIIRYKGKIYYFNVLCGIGKELDCFKNIEICAVGFDDNNDNQKSTGLFLAADCDNNIYECKINLEQRTNDYRINDSIQKLTTLVFDDWDTEEDEEYSEPKQPKYERIYGIKFLKTTKPEKKRSPNDDFYYIIIATKTKFYQFKGPGEKTFLQLFERFNKHPILFNDYCRYFPSVPKISKIFTGSDVDIIYKNDKVEQFGWKTESGFCFGNFNIIDFLPNDLTNFTVIPFEKINSKGIKETGLEPLSVAHTSNHIFVLYKDCLTIVSKLTSNIVHTEYLERDFNGVVFNEFAEENGIILLYSTNGLYQISLKDENKEIWKDYLDIGDYDNAIKLVEQNKKLKRRIYRIDADEVYDANDYLNSVMKYISSDEKFEIVCLKYLMKDQFDALKLYCELYLSANVEIKEENNIEANLITTLIIELMLNNSKEDRKRDLETFRLFIRENRKYIREGNIIYPLVKRHGKMEEFIEYGSIIQDYESVIMYFINGGNIDEALDRLMMFASFVDDKDQAMIDNLINIFLNNSHAFFKYNPKESINLIKQKFKDIPMEGVIQAIICTMDKEESYTIPLERSISKNLKVTKKEENMMAILKYLKTLIDKKNIKEESNIHNLYIYYLLKSRRNQEALLDYLKGPLKFDGSQIFSKKKKVLFQLDYAKKLFINNPPAYSLVLALMGKYSEAVKKALSIKDNECRKIAEFIASNAPGDSLKKQLWIEIFSCDNSQNEFQEALKIMKKSKILKIEDVLPHITDTIKIEDFKKQISECISDYEENIKKLKDDINSYNKTAENIKNDIFNLKKRSMEIPYSSYKCVICQVYIKNKNIYLFPCGHMFDANCIRECLLNYEATGLGYIHEKNMKIDSLFLELGYIEKSSFENSKIVRKPMTKIEEEKTQIDIPGKASTIFNKFAIFKRQEKNDDKMINRNVKRKELELELNAILSEQCVLCGDYMVDSIQCSVCKPTKFNADADGYKICLDDSTKWDYIE